MVRLSTRLDFLSKNQTRSEDVRYALHLHPLKGYLVHFRRFFKTFLLSVQDSNLAESGVFLLILSDSSRNFARGYFWTPYGGVQIMRPHRKWISASRRRTDFVLGSMDAPWCPEQKSNQTRRCQITSSPPTGGSKFVFGVLFCRTFTLRQGVKGWSDIFVFGLTFAQDIKTRP